MCGLGDLPLQLNLKGDLHCVGFNLFALLSHIPFLVLAADLS